MLLIPVVMLGPVAVRQWSRIKGGIDPLASPDLKLWHRVLCVLLAYIFLVGPEAFHRLAQAETQYSQLSTLAWGRGNRIIAYLYDDNGSLTSKTTTEGTTTVEQVAYDYNLQNRLAKVTTTQDPQGTPQTTVVEYRYNPSGIRVEKTETTSAGRTETHYLVDPQNHTGYAQVLEETVEQYDSSDVFLSAHRIQYTIGDDVISQTTSTYSGGIWTAGGTKYLLYDGHGSTRQLAGPTQMIVDSYSYDAYGVMLGDSTNPNPAQTAATSLLYCGEQYDSAVKQYYNRARYYNSSNGLFNRVDPYAGNLHDPQSLHKYLYCHANPINSIDPSGMMGDFTLVGSLMTTAILITLTATPNIANAPGPNDITIADNTGEQTIDSFYIIAGALVLRFVIAPIFRQGVKYVRNLRPARPYVSSEPGVWYKVKEGMNPRAAAYQTKITGQPVDNGYVVKGVKFDGYKSGTLLDAKGPGYNNFVQDGKFNNTWFRGSNALVNQAERQISVAGGCPIEWHFAEKESLMAVEKLFADNSIEGIKLIYTPN
jgi:RHS repeat-associated protein